MRAQAVIAASIGALLLAQAVSLPRRYADRPALGVGGDSALRAVVAQHSGTGEPVVILGNGQRLGYRVGRPALAVPAAFFTGVRWDEGRIRKVAARYGARLVIVSSEGADSSAAREFVARLSTGDVPDWLVEVARTPTVRLYAIR
jgi:hypothetical protein